MEFSKIAYCITFLNYLLVSTPLFAQKEGNIWYFGGNAGLDFNAGAPVALTNGALNTTEGSATISDDLGNLLFYTDGITVWNKNHVEMPNGFGLMGGSSSTQAALIVQKPNSSNEFYIFTAPVQVNQPLLGKFGYRYSTVDLTMDGGLGDIVNKNILLHQPATEKLTAIRHANGCDIWVIMHEWNTNGFFAYLVNNLGVGSNPVASFIGAPHSTAGSSTTSAIGQLKASPDGKKLALAFNGTLELFDFDNVTGVVSNPITFPPFPTQVYGVEFSPDGTKLYVGSTPARELYQYNLMAGSSIDVINSETLVGFTSADFLGSLQLGPDGKIYCALVNKPYLAAVNNPNALGAACNYVDSAVSLNGNLSRMGLPTFMQSHFNPQFTYVNTCIGDSTFFSITDATGIDSVFWDFGDPLSGVMNTSTDPDPFHVFTASGTYNIQLTKYSGCTLVYSRTIIIDSIIPTFSLGNDTIVCPGVSLVLNVEVPRANYIWQDSSENNSFTVSSPGIYWLEANNACGAVRDSIKIQHFPELNIQLGNDTILCEGQSLVLNVTVPGANYIWQDGSTSTTYTISFPGLFWVEVTSSNGCSEGDSILIDYSIPPNINLGNDTVLCQGQLLELDATMPGVSYLWQDGSFNSIYSVSSTGLYWVKVTNAAACSGSDSISIKVENIKADFEYEEVSCTNQIRFINLSSDSLSSFWDFGDGTTSNEISPLHTYQSNEKYTVILILAPGSECADTAQAEIPFENDVMSDTLFIPNVFTPNGDGKNDYFEIKGMDNPCVDVHKLMIFNRWGKKVFEAVGSQFRWDGANNGNDLPDGVYFYVLKGAELKKSGSIMLLK